MTPSKRVSARLAFIVAACLSTGAWDSARALELLLVDAEAGGPINRFGLQPLNEAAFTYVIVLSPGERLSVGGKLVIEYKSVVAGGQPSASLDEFPYTRNFPQNQGPQCVGVQDPRQPVKCAIPYFRALAANQNPAGGYRFPYRVDQALPIAVPPDGLILGYFVTTFNGASFNGPPFFFADFPTATLFDAQGNPVSSSTPSDGVAGASATPRSAGSRHRRRLPSNRTAATTRGLAGGGGAARKSRGATSP